MIHALRNNFNVLQAVDEFVCELRLREANPEKWRKIAALALNEEEWTRVRLFTNILQVHPVNTLILLNTNLTKLLKHADESQHAFSASSRPTLHNALPARERLHAKWEKASKKPCYKIFKPAITAGMAKIDEYYQRSGASDAHIIAMGNVTCSNHFHIGLIFIVVLDPNSKMNHFKKHWSEDLISEVEDAVRERVCFLLSFDLVPYLHIL